MIKVERTLLSQYSNAKALVSIIKSLDLAIDPRKDVDQFYKNIWDVSTATGLGLDIWGRIVDVPRKFPFTKTPESFGYDEQSSPTPASFPRPFNDSPFFMGVSERGHVFLDDISYRKLIIIKAMANISVNTIPNYNKILTQLYSRDDKEKRVWAEDGLDMTVTFHFNSPLSDFDRSVLSSSGIVASPCGVKVLFDSPAE